MRSLSPLREIASQQLIETIGPYHDIHICNNKKFRPESPWMSSTEFVPNIGERKSNYMTITGDSELYKTLPSIYKIKRDTKEEELDLLWKPFAAGP